MRFNPFVPHGPEPFTPTPKSGGPVLSTIEFFKKKIDELFRKDSTSVHYTHEDKTNEEKTIARDNIGAQEKLVSGVNLKTVRGQSLLGSGDVPQAPTEWGGITGNLGMQTDLAEALGGKADGSETYTKSETDEKITANVENSVTSTSTTKALSANMGKELQDQIQNLKHSKADEAKPSFSTITINGVNYTEWTLGTRSGRIMLSVDMGGISTEIAAFHPVTGVFVSAPSQYRDTLRFDGEAPVVGASPTLFDHVARESALSGKANISHTHTKSEITDFPTSMPPTAHSHASDGWFTTALEAVKVWVKALLPNWLTPDYVEPATVASVETKVNRSGDTMTGKLIVSAGTDGDTGFRAQLNASNWAELKASKINVKRGSASATRVFSFPNTSGTFAIRGDLNTSIAPAFIANHLYKAGERIVNDGTLYKAKADFTSGAAFRSADWDTDNVVNALGSKRGMTDLSYARTEWKWDDEWTFWDGYQIPESWGDGWYTETYIDHYGQPSGFAIFLADGTYIGGGNVDYTEEHFVACSQADGDPAYGPFPAYASKYETEVTTTDTLALTSDIPNPVKVIDPASATEAGKAADALATKNALDGMITADYVTDFVQQSAILQARIKSVAQSLIRTAFANFDPNEQSFADLVNILKNIGA